MATQAEGEEIRQRLYNIDPIEFEKMVADLWELQGYETEVSQASNDMGVDVIAKKSDAMVDTRLAIQVKRYSEGNDVGRDEVQQYHSMKVQDASIDGAVVVTTSRFTKPAEEWAADHGMKLIDGDDLVELLQEPGGYDVLNEYAPALRSSGADPADLQSEAEKLDVQVPSDQEPPVILPEPFDDEETRQKTGYGLIAVGVIAFWNPMGMQLPMGAIGVLFVLGGVVLAYFAEEAYDAVMPDTTVYREFPSGALVMEYDGTTIYTTDGTRQNATEFTAFDDESMNRQQANVYGTLLEKTNGNLREMSSGSLPTDIVSHGDQWVVAYRFGVQDERPEKIAAEMNLTQQRVVGHLEDFVA